MWAVFVLYHHIFADIDERAAVVALLRGTLFQKDERWRESEIPARRLSLPHPHVSHNNNRPMTHSWEFLAWWILLLYPWLSVSSGSSWQVKAMNESPSLNYFQPLKEDAALSYEFAPWFVTSIVASFLVVCAQIMCFRTHCSQHSTINQMSSYCKVWEEIHYLSIIPFTSILYFSFQLGARWLPYYS